MSHQNSLNRFFTTYIFVLLFTVGIAFTFLIPPFQKPDEESHFNRTLAIVNGVMSCSTKRTVIKVPEQYYAMTTYIKRYEMPLHPEHKLPKFIGQIYLNSNKKAAPIPTDVSAVCNFPVLSYLPSAAGVFIGMYAGFNPYMTFFFGRFTLFITCFVWLMYLYRKTQYKSILLFTASIPVFLHQISAYGYDGVTLMLTLNLFVIITDFTRKEKVPDVRDYISLATFSILYLLSRSGGHELLLLFILLIPARNISSNKWKYMLSISLFYVLIFGIYGLTKVHAVTSFIGNGLPAGADPGKQIQFILHHPLDGLLVMIKTTVTRSTFYVQSMVGILGWLEYGIPHWMYAAYGLLGLWTIAGGRRMDNRQLTVDDELGTNISWYQIGIGVAVLILNYIYILTIFYVVWTPVGDQLVNGIQGRYFLTLLPFFLFLLISPVSHIAQHDKYSMFQKLSYILAIPLFLFVSVSLMLTVYTRYYF